MIKFLHCFIHLIKKKLVNKLSKALVRKKNESTGRTSTNPNVATFASNSKTMTTFNRQVL